MKRPCIYFKGDRPCRLYWEHKVHDCNSCPHYEEIGKRILLIKLDAIGDVIRTTPLVEALKKKYPNCHITWLVKDISRPLIENHPNIDRLFTCNFESVLRLEAEEFDLLLNLDKAPVMAAFANKIKAKEKKGYFLDTFGNIQPFDKDAEYHHAMCMDNWGKKSSNKKHFVQLTFELCGLEFNGEEYLLSYAEDKAYIDSFKKANGLVNQPLIGLVTGCGRVYPHKKWTLEGYVKLAKDIIHKMNGKVILFGSNDEAERNREILIRLSEEEKNNVIDMSGKTSIVQFAQLISICNAIVTGDTSGMHMAIAKKVPVVAMFGPTPSQEIYLYGNGISITPDMECLNCYDQFQCRENPNCMERITEEQVFSALQDVLKK